MKAVKDQPIFARHVDALNWISKEGKLAEYIISQTFHKEEIGQNSTGNLSGDRDKKAEGTTAGNK